MAYPIPALPVVIRPATRIVPSGTLSLGSLLAQQFIGSNARQDRIQFIITNLDPVLSLKLQTINGTNWLTVPPLLPITVETSSDLQVFNPNGTAVNFEVGELYPDYANLHGVSAPLVAGPVGGGGTPSGGTPSGGAPSGGTPSGGGTSSGGSSYSGGSSQAGGGTQPR